MASKSLPLTVGEQRVWLPAMWACLETGEPTTKRESAASAAALECGLSHSNLKDVPTDIMMHIFTFVDIMDYICSVVLVCKSWSLTPNDILMAKNTAKFKLLVKIMFNSFKLKILTIGQNLVSQLKFDLLYTMETSISFALLYTHAWSRSFPADIDINLCHYWHSYPAQPLYYSASKDIRRFSYFYLLHYIHLYEFGERNHLIFHRMYVLLARLVFTGCTLCIGFMMELLYYKFGIKINANNKFIKLNYLNEDEFNEKYRHMLGTMIHQFYLMHNQHIQDKPILVLYETMYSFVKIWSLYARKWNQRSLLMRFVSTYPDKKIANSMITHANTLF